MVSERKEQYQLCYLKKVIRVNIAQIVIEQNIRENNDQKAKASMNNKVNNSEDTISIAMQEGAVQITQIKIVLHKQSCQKLIFNSVLVNFVVSDCLSYCLLNVIREFLLHNL